MRVIDGEDVNEMYWRGMTMLKTDGVEDDSRAGRVLVMPEPIVSSYAKPRQRVLLDMKRAANPFFHLFESLWMLSGRDDVLALNRFITDFGTRFAESDGRVHGAYGHRWRKALGFDQLDVIVERLRVNPRDRQCVLQMWDATTSVPSSDDPYCGYDGSDDLLGDWKDRPCNTHVYFRVREETTYYPEPVSGAGDRTGRRVTESVLDMMVSCRSNDIVYGAYGANAVHFSILQEYVAGRVGVKVGKMDQMSFNYHAYVDVLERVGIPSYLCTYRGAGIRTRHMGNDWNHWDDDLKKFMLWHQGLVERGEAVPREDFVNDWFRDTAAPMFLAHFKFKNAMHREAYDFAKSIAAEDWRYACLQWFEIRTNARSR